MNIYQYQYLCRVADEILLAQDSSHVRVAIPWLHIVREHPFFIKNYEFLFEQKRRYSFILRMIKHFIRNILSLCKVILMAVISNSYRHWHRQFSKQKQTKIIFVSHLLNRNEYQKEIDF